MTPQLKAITITDFRSLRGTVTIPLGAPVVLIHGPNGAGKTSVLSAIELALTGQLQAMRRAEPNYRSYLLHRGANAGTIALTTADVCSDGSSTVNIGVGHTRHEGRPLLDSDVPFVPAFSLPTPQVGEIADIEPLHVAAYIEALGKDFEKPTVKQHLAAIRMLFDWLVTGQVVAKDYFVTERRP
jgi:hypothetical protein